MEPDGAPVADDAVAGRGGHVAVAEHVAPPAGFQVRGGHHAPGLVTVGYDLEQESGALDVAGQVAQFVDDRRFGLADRLGLGVEVVVVFGFAQAHD